MTAMIGLLSPMPLMLPVTILMLVLIAAQVD